MHVVPFILLLVSSEDFLFPFILTAQNYYSPSLLGNEWETTTRTNTGSCTDDLDSLSTFLAVKNTKVFIILKDGKIAFRNIIRTSGSIVFSMYWVTVAKNID